MTGGAEAGHRGAHLQPGGDQHQPGGHGLQGGASQGEHHLGIREIIDQKVVMNNQPNMQT